MPNTVDILCALDAETLSDLSQDFSNPTKIKNENVFMAVNQAQAISGECGPDLKISARVGDQIRWRATSLNSNFDLVVTLYNLVSRWEILSKPVLVGGFSGPRVSTASGFVPIGGQFPLQLKPVPEPYHYLQSSVQATGSIHYEWWFQVNDGNDGAVKGYGKWAGVIKISG